MSPARATLARWLYATALRLATPLWLARLWWRGAREPLYRAHLGERLGWGAGAAGHAEGAAPADGIRGAVSAPPAAGLVWVHAVSLGETRAAAPLVAALRARHPGMRLLLTHGTATGREAGQALLQPGDVVCWLPIDTPGAARRFLARHRPALGVLMETEVWPVLLHEAARAGVPVALASARLSARSLARGQRVEALLVPALRSLCAVLAQSEADAQRLRAFGARDVRVCGNLKFDLRPDAALLARGRQWREALGRAVVLAAVTREGEEAALLREWAAQPAPRPLLVIVPRHPQRFDEVARLVAAAGLACVRRSAFGAQPVEVHATARTGPAPGLAAWPPGAPAADVWLGDSLGEMPQYYGLADVALLGGSFEPLGGQNLIEAAACGCPLLMGPHTFNFAQAAELALAAGAAQRVPDMAAAVARARQWLEPAAHGRATLADMARQAQAFAAAHQGAAARMAAALEPWLPAACPGRSPP